MPDDRLFHKRLGHSEKVGKLTDLEFIVWASYILSADDFGVMRFSAVTLQADHDRLARRPQKVIQRALEVVRDGLLISAFEHQGRMHCASHDWQNHQRVKHPRQTINPKPPTEMLETFSHATRTLFLNWPGKSTKKLEEDSGNPSEAFPTLARTGARETATAKANGNCNHSGSRASDETGTRAGEFVRRYGELYAENRKGARYISRPALDFQEALQLVEVWDDARLEMLAIAFLTTDDKFCREGSGTIAQFRSRASWCDTRLRESGL